MISSRLVRVMSWSIADRPKSHVIFHPRISILADVNIATAKNDRQERKRMIMSDMLVMVRHESMNTNSSTIVMNQNPALHKRASFIANHLAQCESKRAKPNDPSRFF